MPLEFRLRDFAHPLEILKLRRRFARNERVSAEELVEEQSRLLRDSIRHAAEQVPYYRDLFRRLNLIPSDIRGAADLARLPLLSRDTLREEGSRLRAENAQRFQPVPVRTSGSTGRPIELLMDKPANALEFAYYWRAFGWAGYRLGDPFAELGSGYFLARPDSGPVARQRVGNRLLLNTLVISDRSALEQHRAVREHRSRFLKGLPSVLLSWSDRLESLGAPRLRFRAVFATGEVLGAEARKTLSERFSCPVFNSYGHMERTVAASDCPEGQLHVHPDYGLMELLPTGEPGVARVVGTSLHARAMPLIRYDLGDEVELPADPGAMGRGGGCSCGLPFPRLARVRGRQGEVIRAPDGRVLTAAFLLLDETKGIRRGQLVQAAPDLVRVRLVPGTGFDPGEAERLCARLRALAGPKLRVVWETRAEEELGAEGRGGPLRPGGKVPRIIPLVESRPGE